MVDTEIIGEAKNISKKETMKLLEWTYDMLKLKRFKYLEMVVRFDKNLRNIDKLFGYCIWEDDYIKPREFEIGVDANLSYAMIRKTIFHEMIHVKQYASGMLKDRGIHNFWNGVSFRRGFYKDSELPWELDAYAMEEILYDEWRKYKKHS